MFLLLKVKKHVTCRQTSSGLWLPLKFKGISFFGKGVINLVKIKIKLIFDSIFYFLATKYQLILLCYFGFHLSPVTCQNNRVISIDILWPKSRKLSQILVEFNFDQIDHPFTKKGNSFEFEREPQA